MLHFVKLKKPALVAGFFNNLKLVDLAVQFSNLFLIDL